MHAPASPTHWWASPTHQRTAPTVRAGRGGDAIDTRLGARGRSKGGTRSSTSVSSRGEAAHRCECRPMLRLGLHRRHLRLCLALRRRLGSKKLLLTLRRLGHEVLIGLVTTCEMPESTGDCIACKNRKWPIEEMRSCVSEGVRAVAPQLRSISKRFDDFCREGLGQLLPDSSDESESVAVQRCSSPAHSHTHACNISTLPYSHVSFPNPCNLSIAVCVSRVASAG